jgi:hypothetical protein
METEPFVGYEIARDIIAICLLRVMMLALEPRW